jgi:hypothetical protein
MTKRGTASGTEFGKGLDISDRVFLFNKSTMPERHESSQPPIEQQSRPPHGGPHGDRKRHRHARRSRSPRGDEDRHKHKRHRSQSPPTKAAALPYKAKPLSKRHYDEYKPLFHSYLDIQKNIQLDELDEREAKGRWKSFIGRWYVNFYPRSREYTEEGLMLTLQESWRSCA